MAVSKKLRFEVFKRDSFACQYCGRTPPAVILECDHVLAVANGGTDEEENLITACFDCNRGKSDALLEAVLPTFASRIAKERELAEQAELYGEFRAEQKAKEDAAIDEIGCHWFNQFRKKKNASVFGDSRTPSIRSFLRNLTKAEILDAVEIAHTRKPLSNAKSDDRDTFRYFCGICWNMIRERQERI